MDYDDIVFCQKYFKEQENHDPTITEIRMIDTYWSDHCRHTTFLTELDHITISNDYIQKTYNKYLDSRKLVYGDRNKPICLMDMATIGAKRLKKEGLLPDIDESEEINACSVKIKADVEGEKQDWLLMFKNETHNHPTEIEPFGGAATCLGGAIRDPLSGRSYVYQAMRVTGCADPRLPLEQTMHGKLPQKKLTLGAASGYSSYGNQIGLATGQVSEIYHPGYIAKRLEIGAVIGAVPEKQVRRECPEPGDIVILLGGHTGRDGCGGATGSSKSHTLESLESCGAEVQKGNPPEERKLQRLFRNETVTHMIKRCNDFGAGGVSVAIGELADGLIIDLNAVPRKYEGLDGTELAISESQERMAVVVAKSDMEAFIKAANEENLDAVKVADITAEARLKMIWNGKTIVDINREFLNSNGASKHTDASIPLQNNPFEQEDNHFFDTDIKEKWLKKISELNICSQKGLGERFDGSIGAGSVLMPFGGKHQLTPAQAMVAKFPVLNRETSTCSLMGFGYNPYVSEISPYHGALYAVIESASKVVATGGSYKKMWLTFQEYFERTKGIPERWGKPAAALLGALEAQLSLSIAAIGGKDSMSGSFENIDVPPTLVSFAVSVGDTKKIVSPEFKSANSRVIIIRPLYLSQGLPDFDQLKGNFEKVETLINEGKAKSVWTLSTGGICEAITKISLGNMIGFHFSEDFNTSSLFELAYGGFIVELAENVDCDEETLGFTTDEKTIVIGKTTISLCELSKTWQSPLEEIFPTKIDTQLKTAKTYSYYERNTFTPKTNTARPKVLIPVFPGTNCEYDTARQFEAAGAETNIFVIRNLTSQTVEESVLEMDKLIKQSQIIMIPGGFSGGDEPDGSGKFIATFFRNERIKNAVNELLKNRDGLMLGICNGFQALIKLGLVPYGEICDMDENCPTLTFNSIGRHQSMMVNTRIASVKSPWLMNSNIGDIHTIPISHGEGRFVATYELISKLVASGQIATQYVDLDNNPSMDIRYNPNTSIDAIEGITSPDGRILGKMAHSERIGDYVAKNIIGNKNQRIFEAGVKYFK